MDRYVAAKPVRFDRDYAIGDELPCDAVSPKMAKRLVGWGMIAPAGDSDCPVCGRRLGSKSALTAHMRKEHPDFGGFLN